MYVCNVHTYVCMNLRARVCVCVCVWTQAPSSDSPESPGGVQTLPYFELRDGVGKCAFHHTDRDKVLYHKLHYTYILYYTQITTHHYTQTYYYTELASVPSTTVTATRFVCVFCLEEWCKWWRRCSLIVQMCPPRPLLSLSLGGGVGGGAAGRAAQMSRTEAQRPRPCLQALHTYILY